jgi:hypothetical protein
MADLLEHSRSKKSYSLLEELRSHLNRSRNTLEAFRCQLQSKFHSCSRVPAYLQ